AAPAPVSSLAWDIPGIQGQPQLLWAPVPGLPTLPGNNSSFPVSHPSLPSGKSCPCHGVSDSCDTFPASSRGKSQQQSWKWG
ncbi:unnamed protein product, partial [Coccothraustes coccothraustes]